MDDFYNVQDILDNNIKQKFSIEIIKSDKNLAEDIMHIGYLPISQL